MSFVALPRNTFRSTSLNTAFCDECTAETAIKLVSELGRLGMIACDDLLVHSYNPVTQRDEFKVVGKTDIFGRIHFKPFSKAAKLQLQKSYLDGDPVVKGSSEASLDNGVAKVRSQTTRHGLSQAATYFRRKAGT